MPNIIIILADDLGYGDLSCFGSKIIKTPNLDKLASEGIKFTNFWTTCSVCSPSRASLLTGRYPQRCGVPYAVGDVYSDLGLADDEVTIAEFLKTKGYSTAAIGKWHLGIPQGFNYSTNEGFNPNSEFHPNHQGFDLFFGAVGNAFPSGRIPLIEDGRIVQDSITVATVTDEYNSRAIEFMNENKSTPFFIYFAHTRPHAPWIPNPAFAGKSEGGVYGDLVEELDASVGKITETLKKLDLEKHTLIIFTSDNGAAITADNRYGSNLPFRGGKGTTWDGGLRVPGIFYWPGQIDSGVICNTFVSTLDLLPTIANLTSIELPDVLKIDGKDISPLLINGCKEKYSDDKFYYYNGENLQAVREGKWKLHLPREEKMLVWWESGMRELKNPMLFNIESDSSEIHDVAAENPEIVSHLLEMARKVRNELGSWDKPGTGQKDIENMLNDRTTLQILRTQQNHQHMGVSEMDSTVPEINKYYWGIAKEGRRKKLQEIQESEH